MVVLKKQKVRIEKDGQHSLLIVFGKKKKIRIKAYLETLTWEDVHTGEQGKGKGILKHLGTMDKSRQIKESGDRNACEVTLCRGALEASPTYQNEYVVMHAHILFRKK